MIRLHDKSHLGPCKTRLGIESLESRRVFSATPLASPAAQGNVKLPYSYYVTGNAGDKVVDLPPTSSGLALMGGGTDVDEVFRWIGAKANGGDFLVIRATGTNAYDRYIDGLVPSLDSVATLIIPDLAAAMHPDVKAIIQGAEAIFIAGGDQADYVNFWNDTPVEAAVYAAVLKNVPIGGTSAGLAVLGDIDFSSAAGTITSSEALFDPLDPRIVTGLNKDFLSPEELEPPVAPNQPVRYKDNTILKYMDDVITDSHFMQRDRQGRLLTFMANMDARNLVPALPRAIGVNEQTALLIGVDGVAKVVGNTYSKRLSPAEQQRSVYLFQGSTPNPVVSKGVPLTYSAQGVIANYDPTLSTGDTFDLDNLFASNNWSLTGLDNYDLTANQGVITVFGNAMTAFNLDDIANGGSSAKRRVKLI